ncbi:hypothetical protein LRS06_20055 [Hymenobacter sp. J193]|uniref:hypothetical protein n=1 Tax=Hymenobacter sp. J193 TaxID=2898429 RepID=UPI0021515BBE|nr:hypothetical protein [Hymenobacter sp. J193]MCR5890024.1 hypothetical protein [Hymenobacter sp. J193]
MRNLASVPLVRKRSHSSMKLLLVFALLLPLRSYGQPASPRQLYQQAFRHITSDSIFCRLQGASRCVAVFDNVVHIPPLYFLEELGQQWGYTSSQQKRRLVDSLTAVDRSSYHKPYFSKLTARLTTASGTEEGCVVVLFSRLANNMLLAEISDNQNGGPGLRNILSTFDQSIQYLFVFGSDGKVQRCYTKFINHN